MKKSVLNLLVAFSALLILSTQAHADECKNKNKYYVGYFGCEGNANTSYSVRILHLAEEDKTCPASSPINTETFAFVIITDKATQAIKAEIKLAEGEFVMTDMGAMKAQLKVPSIKLKLNCETLPGGGFSIGN